MDREIIRTNNKVYNATEIDDVQIKIDDLEFQITNIEEIIVAKQAEILRLQGLIRELRR